MKKLLNNPWFSGLLVLAAIAFVAQSLLPSNARPRVAAGSDVVSSDETAASAPAASIHDALAALQVPASMRNPYAPRTAPGSAVEAVAPKKPDETSSTFLLSAVWRQDALTLALINGSIQSAGSHFGPLHIESIQPDGVWVTHHKGRTFLSLGAPFVLTTPLVSAAKPARSGG